jgi:hypothetical protein
LSKSSARQKNKNKQFVYHKLKIEILPKNANYWAQKMGKLLSSHRSTIYPCYVPILGDLTGAGRERLTRRKNRKFISLLA